MPRFQGPAEIGDPRVDLVVDELMIDLRYEMTYSERIEGPLPATTGSLLGERVCWQVAGATLRGPRIDATLAMPGIDWIRVGADGATPAFTEALANGRATTFSQQYMYMVPRFEVGGDGYRWLTDHLFVALGRIAGSGRIEYEIARVAQDPARDGALREPSTPREAREPERRT